MRIDVTAEDILNGQRGNPASCPIALAMIRAGYDRPRVYFDDVEFRGDDGKQHRVPFPASVEKGYSLVAVVDISYGQRWMLTYDRGGQVEPITLFVDAVEQEHD